MDRDELRDKLLELRRDMDDLEDLDYAIDWLSEERDRSAKSFMDTVKEKRIVEVYLLKGAEDMPASECQFEFELENGYSFVG